MTPANIFIRKYRQAEINSGHKKRMFTFKIIFTFLLMIVSTSIGAAPTPNRQKETAPRATVLQADTPKLVKNDIPYQNISEKLEELKSTLNAIQSSISKVFDHEGDGDESKLYGFEDTVPMNETITDMSTGSENCTRTVDMSEGKNQVCPLAE
ncbi:hypothetical protein TREMEDRAFT_61432 [Tremella mesenterica DSM 1558]|uniref:uncharacterized protein n=1 Tax=Tremella mesenterica (strain ATCC 24925 / CBS 8224 / DSM 1558 / NBRC 9311 / NRRL Y-6157 / RJB 2259-6 / UBC 559-6) TaxID=578456 RepID=UPI0003F49D7D|nr:uncharacterized protein TREMEDRAFT_61432 [Tremella mesenterica DSM 1558]EIW70921.1 hypothetical protein TREMEDRAFT_61432 [Tremella mesenterica DSM 1558]